MTESLQRLTHTIAAHVAGLQGPSDEIRHALEHLRAAAAEAVPRAFAELIGPDAPMFAPGCRVGFTVMAENTTYPLHAHPAVELYLVVSGTAQWSNATAARCVPPGEWVLHHTNEPHAMRSFDQPLLALWCWSGDLDAPAAYL